MYSEVSKWTLKTVGSSVHSSFNIFIWNLKKIVTLIQSFIPCDIFTNYQNEFVRVNTIESWYIKVFFAAIWHLLRQVDCYNGHWDRRIFTISRDISVIFSIWMPFIGKDVFIRHTKDCTIRWVRFKELLNNRIMNMKTFTAKAQGKVSYRIGSYQN